MNSRMTTIQMVIFSYACISITMATTDRLEIIENKIRSLDLKLAAHSLDFATLKHEVSDTNQKLDVLLAIMNASSKLTNNKTNSEVTSKQVTVKTLKDFEAKVWTELSRVKRSFVTEKTKLQKLQKRYDFNLQQILMTNDNPWLSATNTTSCNHSAGYKNDSMNAVINNLSDAFDLKFVNLNDSIQSSLRQLTLDTNSSKPLRSVRQLDHSISVWNDMIRATLRNLESKVINTLSKPIDRSQQRSIPGPLKQMNTQTDMMTMLTNIYHTVRGGSGCNRQMTSVINAIQRVGDITQYSLNKLVRRLSLSDIRLANSSTVSNGRLEVYVEGEWGRSLGMGSGGGVWGTVCDDMFDRNAATVVCRMFGYRAGIPKARAYFGLGKGPIVMDNVNCKGTEYSLWDCTFTKALYCQHSEDVGVVCFD